MLGFKVTVEPEIIEEETVKASTNSSSISNSFIVPEPEVIFSLNLNIMFWSSLTARESSEGVLDNNIGKSLSITTATLLVSVVVVTAVPEFPAVS